MHVLYASMHVDLTENCNVQVSCGLEALPEELSGLSSIELLDLRGNSGLLQAGGAPLVTAGLTCLSSCRRLDLRLLKYRLDCGRLSCASSCHAFAGLSRASLQPAVGFAANWHEPQCHALSMSNISVLRCKTSCILIAFGCAFVCSREAKAALAAMPALETVALNMLPAHEFAAGMAENDDQWQLRPPGMPDIDLVRTFSFLFKPLLSAIHILPRESCAQCHVGVFQ